MSGLTEYQKAQKWLEGFDWDNNPDASEHLATICEALQEIEKIKAKQEQGLLISLPCPVGTVIYIVNRYWHSVELGNICGFAECDDVDCFCYKVYVDPDTYENIAIADFGVDWFLTEAEAEETLAKLGGLHEDTD